MTRLYYTENVNSGSAYVGRQRKWNETANDLSYVNDDAFDFDHRSDITKTSTTRTSSRRFRTSTSETLRQPSRKDHSSSSAEHAINQVHALMDLYDSSNAISNVIVATALEGVVQKVFQDKDHLKGCDSVFDQLQALIFRGIESQAIPRWEANAIFSTVWRMMRQRYVYNPREHVQKASKFLAEGLSLLSQESHLRDLSNDFAGEIFEIAKSNHMNMTIDLWNVYLALYEACSDEKLLRTVQSNAIQLLSTSPITEWKEYQYSLLNNLQRQFQATNNTIYFPSDMELQSTLSVASKAGDAQQATWIFRRLYHGRRAPSEKHQLWYLLLQAYARSNQDGAVTYMERLLLSNPEMHHREFFNLLLQARSRRKDPGSGLQAEAFLKQVELLDTSIDIETLYHCVVAHVDEEPRTLQNALAAEHLVRRMVAKYNMTSHWDNDSQVEWPLFKRILQAYATLPMFEPSQDHKTISEVAENFLRFFLIQHRDGIVSEKPDATHLNYMLQILNRGADASSKKNAETSVEFFRLFESLSQNGKIESRPTTVENSHCLLDTLAKTKQPGYGDYAEMVFQLIARRDRKITATSLQHMLNCVIECHQRDGNEKRANKLLDLYNFE